MVLREKKALKTDFKAVGARPGHNHFTQLYMGLWRILSNLFTLTDTVSGAAFILQVFSVQVLPVGLSPKFSSVSSISSSRPHSSSGKHSGMSLYSVSG